MLTRRVLLVIGMSLVLSLNSFGLRAEAKDGESSGDSHSGSDHSSGGGSGERSGRNSDDRSGSNKDNDHDDMDDDKPEKIERKGSNKWQSDQDKALEAARKGEIMSLKDALEHVADKYNGKVIDVILRTTSSRDIYQMKIRTPDGTIQEVRMDARTGKFAGLFGF